MGSVLVVLPFLPQAALHHPGPNGQETKQQEQDAEDTENTKKEASAAQRPDYFDHYVLSLLRENLIHLLLDFLTPRCFQVAHRAFDVGMAEPLLYSGQIEAATKTARRERCPELMEPAVFLIKLRSLGNDLETVEEKIESRVTSAVGEEEVTSLVGFCDPFF